MSVTYYHSTARARKLKTASEPKAGVWVHVVEPESKELDELSENLALDRDILADATDVYEAPRVEVSEGTIYVFTRYSHPEGKDASTEPLLIIYTDNNIITIMRSRDKVLDQLIEGQVQFLTTQKTKQFLHILEQINRSYRVQLNLISKQILQLRSQLRRSEVSSESIVKFIELEEDLNEFLSALQPQSLVLTALESGRYMKLYEDDRDLVEDISLNTNELIELSKSRVRTVTNMRQAYSVVATNNLNKIFKRLTSIAIFIGAATLIVGIYGMNVVLPMAENSQAFLIVLATVGVVVFVIFRYFDRRNWF